jgi:predicted transcriptional regulator
MSAPRVPRRGARARQGLEARAPLGPLESQVLAIMWVAARAVTVRDVQLAIPDLAYTTLMTTLDRLYRKGLLLRCHQGRAFAYQPRCSRDELLGELVSLQVTGLLGETGARIAVLSTLVRAVGSSDAALLDELDALVQAERARLRRALP